MEKQINKLGIDIKTQDIKKLINKLKRLKTTINIENGGMYYQDKDYSIVWIDTTLNENQLDEWLYKYSNCNYIGIFLNKNH
jgi:hypothetical protein